MSVHNEFILRVTEIQERTEIIVAEIILIYKNTKLVNAISCVLTCDHKTTLSLLASLWLKVKVTETDF